QPHTARKPRRPRSSRQRDRRRLPAAHSPTARRRTPPAPHRYIAAIRDTARTWTATTTASVASRIGGGSVPATSWCHALRGVDRLQSPPLVMATHDTAAVSPDRPPSASTRQRRRTCMANGVSTLRLWLLRAMYALIAVGLGLTIWPLVLAPPASADEGSAIHALLGALA